MVDPSHHNQDILLSILTNALSSDQSLRSEAEHNITQLSENNFGAFLVDLSSKISNESVHNPIRQIAATIIKNIIPKENYKQKFLALDQEQKQTIKGHILSTLASPNAEIRRAAGMAIAGICKVEIPNKQWIDIFGILVGTSQHENIYIQLSSVITLRYIFQELSVSDVPIDESAKVLNAFYTLLNQSNCNLELLYEILLSFNEFLGFIGHFIQDHSQKILLFDLIKKYLSHPEDKIRNVSLKIFYDIVRLYYDLIPNYFDSLLAFSLVNIENDQPQNQILCYDMWGVIANIEITRIKSPSPSEPCYNLCDKASEKLLPLILNHLVTNDYEEEQWTLNQEAFFILTQFSQCCSYAFIEKVKQFIGVNIQNQNKNMQHAALEAFAAILKSSYHSQLEKVVIDSLVLISCCLTNQNEPDHIREITAVVILNICKYYGKTLAESNDNNEMQYLNRMLALILQSLSLYKRKVVCTLCMALFHLIRSLQLSSEQETNVLSKSIKDIMQQLINTAYSEGAYNRDNNVALNCFYPLAEIVKCSAKDTRNITSDFFEFMIGLLEKIMQPSDFGNNDEEMRNDYQNYLLICFSAFLALKSQNPNSVKKLLKIVISTFESKKCVYSEGLLCIGSIAICLGKEFEEFIPQTIPYIKLGLESINDTDLCRRAVHCCSEIFQYSSLSQSHNYVKELIPLILNILSNSNVDKSLKPLSFNIISDLFLLSSEIILPYYTQIMSLLTSAFTASLEKVQRKDDQELFEYFIILREHLLEVATAIFDAVDSLGQANNFFETIPFIMNFINTINTEEYCPSFEIMKLSLGIIGDFCKAYQTSMKPYLNVPLTEQIIKNVKAFQTNNTEILNTQETQENLNETIEWAKTNISNALL